MEPKILRTGAGPLIEGDTYEGLKTRINPDGSVRIMMEKIICLLGPQCTYDVTLRSQMPEQPRSGMLLPDAP